MFDHLRDYVAMEAAKRQCRFAEAARLADGLMQRQTELNRISPFLGYEPYAVYGPDWEAKRMRQLRGQDRRPGRQLVAVLPETARGAHRPLRRRPLRTLAGRRASTIPAGKRCSPRAGWENQGFRTPRAMPIAA